MRHFLLGLLAFASISAFGSGDIARGEAAYAVCSACHGAEGQGQRALNAPALVNLDAEYVARQLISFRDGWRGGDGDSVSAIQMRAIAATLRDDEVVADVAAYIDSLPPTSTEITVQGDLALGQSQYDMICGACHGGRAEGNLALQAPVLAGVDDWYLMSQIEAFRAGTRGTHPDDRLGAQMRSMAGIITSDEAARNVVSYIRSLEPQWK